jgi:GH15 family glucan-1,4-alpha-glucosidase
MARSATGPTHAGLASAGQLDPRLHPTELAGALLATIDAVERERSWGTGLLRYPEDRHRGRDPWLLTRMWRALARRAPGASVPAEGQAAARAAATGAELLPEQGDARTGRPAWVGPLA